MSQARRSAAVDGFLNRQFSGLVTRLRKEAGPVDGDEALKGAVPTESTVSQRSAQQSESPTEHISRSEIHVHNSDSHSYLYTPTLQSENKTINEQNIKTSIVVNVNSEDQTISSSSKRPAPSLLTLPFELRHQILTQVYTREPFLSSKQQVSASDQSRADTSLHPSSNPPPPQPLTSSKRAFKKPDRFTHPSQSFRGYAESRHADTALLYVNRQLRRESLPLYHDNKYYLTLVIEQAVPLTTRDDDYISDDNDNDNDNDSRTDRGAKRKDPRNLRFVESDQRSFWTHVAADLILPDLHVARAFRSFSVSLFVEESAFKGISAWEGVNDGLRREEIVRILFTHRQRQVRQHQAQQRTQERRGDKDGDKEEKDEGVGDGERDQTEETAVYEEVGFYDYTALKLARNAMDMSVASGSRGERGRGQSDEGTSDKNDRGKHRKGQCNVSLSIEMWRI